MSAHAAKTTWLSSLGAGLEYYDFIIYGMMAPTLNLLFFQNEDPWIGLMKTFAIFAVGYLARPLGGLLFGMIGDTAGRKTTFLAVMFLMAISTFAMGCLPTAAQAGAAAPLLLLLCRILQGLSFGAELPGAIVVVNETAAPAKRGVYSGFVVSSTSLGSLLATLTLALLMKSVSQDTLLHGAWRIPLLFGGLLALVSWIIRRSLRETPAFLSLKERRVLLAPLQDLLTSGNLLRGIGMTLLPASLILFALYMPVYFQRYLGHPLPGIYQAMTIGMIWSALSLPLAGLAADRLGRSKFFLTASLVFALSLFFLFRLPLIPFMIIYQTFISCLMASYFPLLFSLFPTKARFTGVAFCYNVVFAAMGWLPLGLTFLIERTSPTASVWYLEAAALVSCLSQWRIKETHGE